MIKVGRGGIIGVHKPYIFVIRYLGDVVVRTVVEGLLVTVRAA